jgi:hypothetical protein
MNLFRITLQFLFFCFVIFDSGNSGSHDHYFETIIILGAMHIEVGAMHIEVEAEAEAEGI